MQPKIRDLSGRPGDWADEAACAGQPPRVFFGADQQAIGRWAPRAKAICATCVVAPECLQFALRTHQEHGVWGGTDPDDRARILRNE